MAKKKIGMVVLVGAGPGDPGLITVKGLRLLKAADVVVYDRLVSDELLAQIPKKVKKIYVGKRPGKPSMPQEQINTTLVAEGTLLNSTEMMVTWDK